jgi:YD repeat-containing protein
LFSHFGNSLVLAKDNASTPTPLLSGIQFSPFGGVLSWQWQATGGPLAHNRVYDTSGRLVRYPLGGIVRDLSFDAAERITSYTHCDAAAGAMTTASSALNQTFGYDELGRLTGITTPTASWTIGYDANGNRTGVTLNGTASAYTTSATSNRLDSTPTRRATSATTPPATRRATAPATPAPTI